MNIPGSVRIRLYASALAAALAVSGCVSQQQLMENAYTQLDQQTGLKKVEIPETKKAYLGKKHRGYDILYTASAGDVWGRYAARLTMGEIGRETGGILGFLTGSREHIGSVAGSPLDRLLSKAIGQPLSVVITLKHAKPKAPRLDILSGYAVVGPEDKLPEQSKISYKAGSIYSANADFARKISSNDALMKRLKNMRCEYIRVDQHAVTFLWAGSETDYSGMISDHGDYYKMLNSIMDSMADIADNIPNVSLRTE